MLLKWAEDRASTLVLPISGVLDRVTPQIDLIDELAFVELVICLTDFC